LSAINAGASEAFDEALDTFEKFLTANVTSEQVHTKAWSFFGFIKERRKHLPKQMNYKKMIEQLL